MGRLAGKFIVSHTDKTDPFWVQMATGYHKHVGSHDHLDGICDIETFDWKTYRRGSCSKHFVYTGTKLCNCGICSKYAWTGSPWPAERRTARLDADRWRYDYNASHDITEWWSE